MFNSLLRALLWYTHQVACRSWRTTPIHLRLPISDGDLIFWSPSGLTQIYKEQFSLESPAANMIWGHRACAVFMEIDKLERVDIRLNMFREFGRLFNNPDASIPWCHIGCVLVPYFGGPKLKYSKNNKCLYISYRILADCFLRQTVIWFACVSPYFATPPDFLYKPVISLEWGREWGIKYPSN